MLNRNSRFQAGFTLVEMMVGIVVGLVVLWGMSTVYVNSARSSRTTTTADQLNQDLRAVMDIMVSDIRRAGYWDVAPTGVNPFTVRAPAPTTDIQISNTGTADADCILYSYDATYKPGNTVGVVDGGLDFFGFQLANGVVQTLDPAANLANTSTACASTQWQNLTDERAINVTRLTFVTGDAADATTGSKCIAFAPATYIAASAATFTSWTSRPTAAGAIYQGPACDPSAPNAPAGGAYPAAANTFVETRQIRITLTAHSVADPSLSRSLTETVLVRANRVIAP